MQMSNLNLFTNAIITCCHPNVLTISLILMMCINTQLVVVKLATYIE